MALLEAQIALTTLFLALTILETHRKRAQILKGSSLATLCALDEQTRQHVGSINDLEMVNRKAKSVGVRLEVGASGTGLWLGMKKLQ